MWREFGALLRAGRLRLWELVEGRRALREVCHADGGGGGGERGWRVLATTRTARVEADPAVVDPEGLAQESQEPVLPEWGKGLDLANQIMLTEPLLDAIPTDNYLVFQADGNLCRAPAPGDLAALRRAPLRMGGRLRAWSE